MWTGQGERGLQSHVEGSAGRGTAVWRGGEHQRQALSTPPPGGLSVALSAPEAVLGWGTLASAPTATLHPGHMLSCT